MRLPLRVVPGCTTAGRSGSEARTADMVASGGRTSEERERGERQDEDDDDGPLALAGLDPVCNSSLAAMCASSCGSRACRMS